MTDLTIAIHETKPAADEADAVDRYLAGSRDPQDEAAFDAYLFSILDVYADPEAAT
jgi:hypothetical protein